jgi:AraC-like DNA-binding protein
LEIAFSTGRLAPADRLAAWRELVNRVFLPLAITPQDDRAFEGTVTGRTLGGMRVWRITASPMTAVRGPRHIEASGSDDYLLALHVAGTARAVQDGRELVLGPGDFALFDSSRPYTISFSGMRRFRHVIYQVPRASLDARHDAGQVTALRVPASSRAGRLVSPYLRALARQDEVPAGAFIEAGLDLAMSALRSAGGYPGVTAQDPGSHALKDYALAPLGDPALCPQAVASACYVSARQLHRIFAREGLTFGGWAREQRLRRCYDDLTDPALAHLTVAEIAARWGFRSAAHFGRAFQARYGTTPGSHRRS